MAEQFQNFSAALKKLEEFCRCSQGTEIEKAGVIQAFEYTFEQCWKAIQKIGGNQGVNIASPKKAFEWAFQNKWIQPEEESLWLKMLDDRNLTSHTYRAQIAEQVYASVRARYLKAFEEILHAMEK